MDDALRAVSVLSYVLNRLVSRTDALPETKSRKTKFHALKIPKVSIQAYLERIVKYAPCSPECFILSLIYVDKVIQRNSSFSLSSYNVHRLLLTSIMLAAKYFDDSYYNNAYYAKVGGIQCCELNNLELEFLYLLDYRLNVAADVFERYRSELMKHASKVSADIISVPTGVPTPRDSVRSSRLSTNEYADPNPSSNAPGASRGGGKFTAKALQAALVNLVGEEVRRKCLSPSLVTRASKLFQAKEDDRLSTMSTSLPCSSATTAATASCAPLMSPGIVRCVCEVMVNEYSLLSPSLVRRAADITRLTLPMSVTVAD